MSIKVTLLISVYDTEKYLEKCLDSIINQTLKDIEIIIVNDQSPDNSIDIIRQYEKNDERIRVFDIKNQGVSHARNLGIKHAKGECIIFIDSDDYLNLDMIELMYNEIIKTDSHMAVCNFNRVFDDYIEEPFLLMPKEKTIIIDNNIELVSGVIGEKIFLGGCVWNKLFKTDFLRETKLKFEERDKIYAEDAFFYFKLLKYIKKISIIDQPLYNYYQRKTSVSNSYKTNLIERCINFISELEKYYKGLNLQEEFAARSYTFLIEIMYNEIDNKKTYINFRKKANNKFFRKRLKKVNFFNLAKNQKIIYILYKYRLYFPMYLALKAPKRRDIDYVKKDI